MRTLISGGTLVTPDETLPDHTLVIEGAKIRSLDPGSPVGQEEDRVIDARGMWVTPGLIDVHVHGAGGHSAMDATVESIHGMARFLARHGVTGYLLTTGAASFEDTMAVLDNTAHCPQPEDGAHHLGVHIEGPYLSMEHKGAQPPAQLRDPDPSEYNEWFSTGVVRLMAIAPERNGAMACIEDGVAQGVGFAIAHSGASYEQVLEAADRGLRQAAHTFNGMLGLHHRQPGTVGGVLTDDRIFAEVIGDGVHVHPAVVDLLVRAKGIERTILVTDAIPATGLEDGEYDLLGFKVIVRDGVSRTEAGGLAGSTLTMDVGLRNMMAFAGLSLGEALTTAAATPAAAIGLARRKGVLAPGADADVVLFDKDLHVRLTMVGGRVVYEDI